MRVEYKGYSFITEKVSGELSKVDFKGLDIFFSYEEPIAICYPTKAIVCKADYSSTTSNHISKVKKLYYEIEVLEYEEFESQVLRLFSGNWSK